MTKKVMILMGSDSDLPVMQGTAKVLDELELAYEIHISSAHRSGAKTEKLAKEAAQNGFGVIIAAAGGAAHLAGVVAANTALPVIGVPVKSGALSGLDALYATVQMPPGIPVATVAIDGARNAGILAAQILGVGEEAVAAKIVAMKQKMAQVVEEKDMKLQNLGVEGYLKQK